jgi:hypothetical protein
MKDIFIGILSSEVIVSGCCGSCGPELGAGIADELTYQAEAELQGGGGAGCRPGVGMFLAAGVDSAVPTGGPPGWKGPCHKNNVNLHQKPG